MFIAVQSMLAMMAQWQNADLACERSMARSIFGSGIISFFLFYLVFTLSVLNVMGLCDLFSLTFNLFRICIRLS